MKHRPLLTLMFLTISLTPLGAYADSAPVVRVMTTYQEYDPFQPWQKRSPDTRAGFGVIIDETHLEEAVQALHTAFDLGKGVGGCEQV